MSFDPQTSDLKRLFTDPHMFDSAEDWHDAGFKIVRDSENKILVARHKSADGYLFKKYTNRIPLNEQLTKFKRRVEGARKLRSLIAEKHLRRIVVPQKWLRELPSEFSRGGVLSYVLIVEKFPILDKNDSEYEHEEIDEATLRELCVVVYTCTHLDFTARNAPFTKRDQIAFIDTEYLDWNVTKSRKKYLENVGKYVSGWRLDLAKRMWNELGGGGA